MPRYRPNEEELTELEAEEERRQAIEMMRWARLDREDVDPALRARGRKVADEYLRDAGLLPPGA